MPFCREPVSFCRQDAFYTDSEKSLSLFVDSEKSLIRAGKDRLHNLTEWTPKNYIPDLSDQPRRLQTLS